MESPPPNARPTSLRIGFALAEEAVVDRESAARALAGYLERTLRIDVSVVRTASYGPAIAALARGEIDLIALAPFAYLLAAADGTAEALVATGRPQSGPRTYQSMLIAHRRTGLRHLDELRARAAGLRFNHTDPASNSGYLAPEAKLAALGLDVQRDFRSCEFTLSHSVSIFNVLFDRADVAGVSRTTLDRLIAKGRVRREDLVVLWESDPLPNGPIAVRRALPDAFKRELQTALVDLAARQPATARAVMAQFPEPDLVFLACDDSLYEPLRALAQTIAVRP